jgi:MFS family permease
MAVVLQRPFSYVFAAQTCTELADQVFLVALTWSVLATEHGSGLGLVLAAWTGPRGLFLLLGGVLLDRWDRRLLARGSGAALAALVSLLAVGVTTHRMTLQLWLAAAVLLGLLDGIRLPIGYTLIPLVVHPDQVLAANRWSQLRLWTTLAIGPALGGVAIATLETSGALVLAAALFASSSVLLVGLPPLKPPREERQHLGRELVEGFRFVASHLRLRLLLPVFAVVNLFVLGLVSVGVPLFVKEGLHGDSRALGFVFGAYGAGLFLGTLSMPRWAGRFGSSMQGLFTLFVLSDLGLALMGWTTNLAAAAGAFFLSGFFIGPASSYYQAMLQTTTPSQYLGRVSGMVRAISFGLEPLSAAMVGGLSRVVSAAVLLVTGGLLATTVDLVGLTRGRSMNRSDPLPSATTAGGTPGPAARE